MSSKSRQKRYGTFSCDLCDRTFTRKDVVHRHKKLVHFKSPKVKISRRKACNQCMTSKLKCSGGTQCENCTKRNLICQPGPASETVLDHSPHPHDQQQHQQHPAALAHPPPPPPPLPVSTSTPSSNNANGNTMTELMPRNMVMPTFNGYSSTPNVPEPVPTFNGGLGNDFGLQLESICNTDWLRYDLYNFEMMMGDVRGNSLPTTTGSSTPNEIPTPATSTNSCPVSAADNEENWPFAYRKIPSKTEVVLPPINWSGPASNNYGNDDLRAKMTNLLSKPYTVERWPIEETEKIESFFPASEILDEFIDSFFLEFGKLCPIIHKPSWSKSTASLLELATVITIGAGFSKRPEAHVFSDNLSELIKRTIHWNVDKNRSCLWDEDFLSAMLLQSIYALGSGNKNLYEVADSTRSLLITSARASGMFNLNFEDYGVENWVRYERKKRIAWLIFEFDCTVCTLTASRPCMSLHDLNNNLPCDAAVWECIEPWRDGLKFKPTISNLIHGTQEGIFPNSNWYSRRLVAQALGRSVWDYVELESTVVFRNLKMSDSPNEELMNALDRIKTLHPPHISDAYHVSLTSMIVCYSQLYSHHVIELITTATRQPDQKKIELVLKLLEQKPSSSRFLAWQAGQIIAIIRASPIHAPCETMRLFLAGLYLYWFALSSSSSVSGPTIANIDTVPWSGTPRPNAWIERGGPACVTNCHGNIVKVIGKEGANAIVDIIISLFKDLKVWGLTERFCQILSAMKDLTPKI